MDSIKSLARGGRRSYVASMAIVAALLALAFASGGAVAGRGGTRVYVVGTDPLCTIIPEVPPEFACPAISMADNGDTIAIDGTGTFNPTTRAAAGGGGGTPRNAAGGGGGAVMLDAILQIDCEIGKVPPGATEGFRLVVQAIDLNFNQEVQGLTVFI